jgi:hypothetical protein
MLGALQSAFREPAFLRQGGDALTNFLLNLTYGPSCHSGIWNLTSDLSLLAMRILQTAKTKLVWVWDWIPVTDFSTYVTPVRVLNCMCLRCVDCAILRALHCIGGDFVKLLWLWIVIRILQGVVKIRALIDWFIDWGLTYLLVKLSCPGCIHVVSKRNSPPACTVVERWSNVGRISFSCSCRGGFFCDRCRREELVREWKNRCAGDALIFAVT